MVKPSDLASRRLQAAKHDTQSHYAALTALADEAAFLMRYFLDRGYDYDASLTLTETTLDRYDNQEL
ncbi:hypothetical protein [Corynebacterium simulans]|uniref:hypothetical protein n=1 Tax=Corynebacterium simulans TaxID=146827 RepID=UPI0007854BD0|nr:hypothetical protein [Corynebacterium simulans]